MVSETRFERLLGLSLLPQGSLDGENIPLMGLRLTAGFLQSALLVILLVLSVHAFELGQDSSAAGHNVWDINGRFLTSELSYTY